MKILVINGPNLNFLGIREKNIYGNQDYNYLLQMIWNKAKEVDCDIPVFQSNHEGAIIDRIQEAYFDGKTAVQYRRRMLKADLDLRRGKGSLDVCVPGSLLPRYPQTERVAGQR